MATQYKTVWQHNTRLYNNTIQDCMTTQYKTYGNTIQDLWQYNTRLYGNTLPVNKTQLCHVGYLASWQSQFDIHDVHYICIILLKTGYGTDWSQIMLSTRRAWGRFTQHAKITKYNWSIYVMYRSPDVFWEDSFGWFKPPKPLNPKDKNCEFAHAQYMYETTNPQNKTATMCRGGWHTSHPSSRLYDVVFAHDTLHSIWHLMGVADRK
jgi:hypothetical protein